MSYIQDDRNVFSDCDEMTSASNINKKRSSLSSLIDSIRIISTKSNEIESLFKKRIDKLNMKFYLETEKYLNNTQDMGNCQDKLFLILFKQISLYMEEVNRLNLLLRGKAELEKTTREKLDNKEKDKLIQTINDLKYKNKILEKKLQEKTLSEDRLRLENESSKRQIQFYKEKLQLDLIIKKYQEQNNKRGFTGKENNLSKSKLNSPQKVFPNKSTDFDSVQMSQVIKKHRQLSEYNANVPEMKTAKGSLNNKFKQNSLLNKNKGKTPPKTNFFSLMMKNKHNETIKVPLNQRKNLSCINVH